jgi:AcrR family transcriptional regulator
MTHVVTPPPEPTRRRDPHRRQRILTAAAELVAERGYHDVGISEIAAAAGVTGPAIYRHFDNKSAVLVAMFDRVIDDLTAEVLEIVSADQEPLTMLRAMIESHVRIVIVDRILMRVYHNEIANLPDYDSRRLRRKQRLYLEEWVHILGVLRPKVNDVILRALVHAAVGAIQSTLFCQSGLTQQQLGDLLASVAEAALFVTEPTSGVLPPRLTSIPGTG